MITPDNAELIKQSDVYPQHECGLFGVFGHPNAAVLTYYGLFALQHRGQESAGIVTSNGPGTSFLIHKDMGLVSQVFGQRELEQLKGSRAIGHTRYSTTGTSTIKKFSKRRPTAKSFCIYSPSPPITAQTRSRRCAKSKARSRS